MKTLAALLIASLLSFSLAHSVYSQGRSLNNGGPNRPVKIMLRCQAEIGIGETDTLKVILANRDNYPVPAPRDLTVQVTVLWEGGKKSEFSASIKRGESYSILPIVMTSFGICQIQAIEPNFLSGSTFVVVTGKKSAKEMRLLKVRMRGGADHWEKMPIPIHDTINIRYDSSRTLMADGKDSAQIFVILNRDAKSEIQIDLLTGSEAFRVTIPKGLRYGVAKIASIKSGKVEIQMVGSSPALPVQGVPVSLQFAQPIAKIKCQASPPDISLIENAEIIITLLDADGHPHATLFPRTVSFQIDKGRGEMETSEITIPVGSFGGRTHFRPTILGGIDIVGAMDELETANASLSVSLPVWLLCLSILGGIAGGFIAKLRNNYEHWRILIGTITGFVLYWAFIFSLLHVLPQAIVLNPLSAFAISTLGGWMGTEVFSALLSRFGITAKSA